MTKVKTLKQFEFNNNNYIEILSFDVGLFFTNTPIGLTKFFILGQYVTVIAVL